MKFALNIEKMYEDLNILEFVCSKWDYTIDHYDGTCVRISTINLTFDCIL